MRSPILGTGLALVRCYRCGEGLGSCWLNFLPRFAHTREPGFLRHKQLIERRLGHEQPLAEPNGR